MKSRMPWVNTETTSTKKQHHLKNTGEGKWLKNDMLMQI